MQTLLIFRLASIGDTMVSLPCFHAIAREFPQHRRVLLTQGASVARAVSAETVLRGTGLIDEVAYFPVGRVKYSYSLQLLRKLRALQAHTLVYLADRLNAWQVRRDLFYFRLAGIRDVIGAPLDAGARNSLIDPVSGDLEHEARRLARTISTRVSVDFSPESWDLRLSPAECRAAAAHVATLDAGKPVVAFAPGAKVPAKDWGERNWAELLAALGHARPDVSVVFVGAPEERSLCERLQSLWPGAGSNACGLTSPRELAALLGICDLLVCHDSGPMHVAAGRGTPCVALFGNYNKPRRWFPFGANHRVIYEPRGIAQIAPPRVLDEICAALAA